MGMLPDIATGLGVSIPAAGLLVSAYALGVMAGAPLMTLATGRMKRRTLLIALMGIFTLGNLLSAIASDYAMLMAARVITRSEEHTSELQSLMRISYAVFCCTKKHKQH